VTKKKLFLAAIVTAVWAGSAYPQATRDSISIVGSSTVYPFATVVAEQFGKATKFKTPKIESTGTGGGLKLFCAGVGVENPDIAKMVFMALYNVDKFRDFVFKSTFLDRFDVDKERIEKIRDSDIGLLKFAIDWLKFGLFGQKLFRVKQKSSK